MVKALTVLNKAALKRFSGSKITKQYPERVGADESEVVTRAHHLFKNASLTINLQLLQFSLDKKKNW